jgi:hypothetical protein
MYLCKYGNVLCNINDLSNFLEFVNGLFYIFFDWIILIPIALGKVCLRRIGLVWRFFLQGGIEPIGINYRVRTTLVGTIFLLYSIIIIIILVHSVKNSYIIIKRRSRANRKNSNIYRICTLYIVNNIVFKRYFSTWCRVRNILFICAWFLENYGHLSMG